MPLKHPGWRYPCGLVSAGLALLVFLASASASACPSPHFQAVATYDGLTNARALAVSDLNLDGRPDLVVERLNGTSMTLSIFGYGPNGRTDLTTVGSFRLPTELGPMRFGRLNADLAPDLAMISPGLRRFSIYMNNGMGGFANPLNYTLPADLPNPGLTDIGLVDFDGDGDLDIVLSLKNSQSVLIGATGVVVIYRNNGSGSFSGPASSSEYYYPGPKPLAFLGAGNTDSDGLIDLMFLNNTTAGVSPHVVRRIGGIPANLNMVAQNVGLTADLIDGMLSDLDNHNFHDVMSINTTSVFVRLSNVLGSYGTFANQLTYTPGITLDKVRSTDLNNDGWADIILNSDTAFDAQNSSIGVYMNQGNSLVFGTGNSAFTQLSSRGLNPVAPVFADMDLDGDQDMALLNTGSSTLSIFYNSCVPSCDINGDLKQSVEDVYSYLTDVYPLGMAHPLADFNRDGVLDDVDIRAVVSCSRGNELQDITAGQR